MLKVVCSNCTEKAETYCVDCKKAFCRFCAVLMHHPSTKGEKHSLEEVASYQGVKLVTPVLLDLLMLGVGLVMLSGPSIGADYFAGASYCPTLGRGRRLLVQTDANLFFYYKTHMAKYCDWEDSYWRFFVDAWVRGVLTRTDSIALLLPEAVRALIFEEFVRVLVTPVVALCFALVAALCRLIESWIFRRLYEDLEDDAHRLTHFFMKVERVIKRLSFAEALVIKEKKNPPPLTLPRKRPMTDWVEHSKYLYDRQTRLISFYKAQAQTACRFMLRGSLKAAFLLRLACILLGGNLPLQLAERFGLGELAAKHTAWFAEANGLAPEDARSGAGLSGTRISDWLLSLGLHEAVKRVPLVGFFGQDLSTSAFGAVLALRPLARYAVPALALLSLVLLCKWRLRGQRARFAKEWKKTTCKAIWGDMTRANPFGTEWKTVRFSR
mmetsp:Transcript_16921/g.49526  ORF Transcript_16921/g.49526 Transcript_16921/m.49526 type:complete len:439 (-) Transcript_16921:38-1354(-)